MAIEYRLSHTASEIDRKLATVDETKNALESNYYTSTDIDTKLEEVNAVVEEVNSSLGGKADLDENGKLLASQLPDDIGSDVDLSDYYTKNETNEALSVKADLVDGKVPLEQLPDDIGGGLTEVSWEDVKNKPFEDTRVMSFYSQIENPNPVSFDVSAMNYSFYKVSDLVLTREEIFNSKIYVNGNFLELKETDIIVESDDFIGVQTNGIGLSFCNKAGTLNVTVSGYPLSIDVPEAGVYNIFGLGYSVPDGLTVEIVIGGKLKTLDLKYLPSEMALGYDTRKIYIFDSEVTPNPPSYPVPGFGVNGYKIFDLIPTLTDFFNYKIIMNQDNEITEFTFKNQQIILSDDEMWLIQSDQGYYFGLCRREGLFETEFQGIPIVCEVPESGIYFMYSDLPTNTTFEINLGGELKQIDPKFIPANLDFDLSDYYTKVEVNEAIDNIDLGNYYTKAEIDTIIGDVNTVLEEISVLIGE